MKKRYHKILPFSPLYLFLKHALPFSSPRFLLFGVPPNHLGRMNMTYNDLLISPFTPWEVAFSKVGTLIHFLPHCPPRWPAHVGSSLIFISLGAWVCEWVLSISIYDCIESNHPQKKGSFSSWISINYTNFLFSVDLILLHDLQKPLSSCPCLWWLYPQDYTHQEENSSKPSNSSV